MDESIPYLWAILDEEGNVIPTNDSRAWGVWYHSFRQIDNGHIAKDRVKGYYISTVFLGININGELNPEWFETEVFKGDDVVGEPLTQVRYDTKAHALAGHKMFVEGIENGTITFKP